MSMLEAMAVGLPVLASAVGEIPTILYGQTAGFFHELHEGATVFSQSLLKFRDSTLRKQMGDAARSLVVSQFQQQTMIQNYFDLLESVTGKKWAKMT